MKRREFITVLGGMAVAWPVVTRAQQPVKKIGFLSISSPGPHAPFVAAFNEGLKEAGFVEGQNLALNTPGRRAGLIDFLHWPQTLSTTRSMSSLQ
jgi:hypothetical protein